MRILDLDLGKRLGGGIESLFGAQEGPGDSE